ncbi:unnamed protein product [Mytilus coruscus]|uniref:Integrase catalytic domain-containing protein n=1 Tax=Mytilus coruscus TaxID=42192 RepID=A0A6J8A3Y9_MYTCO|nr:unnamed protein product [Mytilus coruscus]
MQIPRSRLRENLCKLDEDGIAERKRGRLHRRVYNVQAPNHLWHVDTNHKLIRWRFIILGGVDGFSRLVTFLKCENNNKAETVYKSFMDGVKAYGMPLRVRSDQGRENILIADYMLATRGPGSMITGKSVHNQRIERLWRDVYEGVLSLHYDLFYFMEDQHLLDILNPVHIYALHYVYLPKINEKLNIWQEAWSRHKLRTVKTSPLCLWTAGNINNLITFQLDDPANYGVDGTIDDNEIENNHERADLNPRPIFSSEIIPVSERCQEQLILHCPSDWTSSNYGIDIYCTALDIIKRY